VRDVARQRRTLDSGEPGREPGRGGSVVRVGDKLITMSERGKLSLIHATPAAYKLISSVQLFDYSQVWSMPIVYRGKLYAKGETELGLPGYRAAK